MQNLLLTVVTLVATHMHTPEGNGNKTNSLLSIDPLKKVPVDQIITKNLETEEGIIIFLEDSAK